MPNFDEISQYMANVKTTSGFGKGTAAIEIVHPVSILTYLQSSAGHLASARQISS